MRKKMILCGVEISKFRRQKKQIKSAITALDVKITDWINAIDTSETFFDSPRSTEEMSEIIGELKFMYLSEVITRTEYRRICQTLSGTNEEVEA